MVLSTKFYVVEKFPDPFENEQLQEEKVVFGFYSFNGELTNVYLSK